MKPSDGFLLISNQKFQNMYTIYLQALAHGARVAGDPLPIRRNKIYIAGEESGIIEI